MSKKAKIIQCPYCNSYLFDYRHGSYKILPKDEFVRSVKYQDHDIEQEQVVRCCKCGKEYTITSLNGKVVEIK